MVKAMAPSGRLAGIKRGEGGKDQAWQQHPIDQLFHARPNRIQGQQNAAQQRTKAQQRKGRHKGIKPKGSYALFSLRRRAVQGGGLGARAIAPMQADSGQAPGTKGPRRRMGSAPGAKASG
jgi:hypothetical protein